MRNLLLLIFLSCSVVTINAQYSLSSKLLDGDGAPVMFANVVLYSTTDSKMIKVESSDENGQFKFRNLENGSYYIEASFIGYTNFKSEPINMQGDDIVLSDFIMEINAVELETAVVKAKRSLIEVKPDRMVFNVEGTINSAGDDALGLLRKAPGVLVDNNNNITVLSRSGVLIYVDGKRLPLTGDDLNAYLSNLPAEQIDRMDIITNPGAKYEAQGNAGIIDIRLKRDKGHGVNGSISGSLSQGRLGKGNISSVGNYRNKLLNTFGTLGYNGGSSYHDMTFRNNQNGLLLDEINNSENASNGINYRWGTDFFIGENSTIGFLVSGQNQSSENVSENRIKISELENVSNIDSVLIAENLSDQTRDQSTYNVNYAFDNKKHSLNIDLDYGRYRNDYAYIQPNRYYLVGETTPSTEVLTEYDTPINIDIYTGKIDYETDVFGGKIGLGSKVSKVATDNSFLFYDILGGERERNNTRSNEFFYDENVYAGYANFQRSINKKWGMSAGLRVESTDAVGDLRAFKEELQEDPVELNYTNYFPSGGLTFQQAPNKTWSLNYGRRINRPDYNVLNPFTVQLSELSFMKGNESLIPEIVNNLELGYTLNYRYNFKLSYSNTTNQITRLIAPDDEDPRAGFITWANLAEQTIYGFNAALPFEVKPWWNAFMNISGGYLNNQADYGDGAIVDIQAFTYSIFQQHTFTLPKGFTGEISGYFSGPGVWGGVFKYNETWSLNLGLQKKFFNDLMNVRLSVNDIFFQSGWDGVSNFDGLIGEGMGNWDSRRGAISISYNFGNRNVKSRKRKTGIEDESKRVGS
ncbi:MAG: iron complex outermembrane receptor protein [Saprospiraceae bacterium]|jgi:iron complex outermembrane receptor protein